MRKWLVPAPLRLPPICRANRGNAPKGRGGVIALIKPQFEAGRKDVSRGDGVIRDPEIHRQVLADVMTFAHQNSFGLKGLIQSPIQGPKGNIEFLARLSVNPDGETVEALLDKVFTKEDGNEMS